MISKEIIRAASTGSVIYGYKMAKKRIDDIKAVIISEDCPNKEELTALVDKKPLHIFKGNNMELGLACGKSFGISVISIVDEGKSNIINLIKK